MYWCTDSNWEAVFPWAGTIKVWIIGLYRSHTWWRWQKGNTMCYVCLMSMERNCCILWIIWANSCVCMHIAWDNAYGRVINVQWLCTGSLRYILDILYHAQLSFGVLLIYFMWGLWMKHTVNGKHWLIILQSAENIWAICMLSLTLECVISHNERTFQILCFSLFWFIDVQIPTEKLYFRERAQSKCGSLDYFDHIPSGGDKKVVWHTYWLFLL